MTKEEFEDIYCKNSDISAEQYKEAFVTLPCACGQDRCNGLAAVENDKRSIEIHNELYAPD